MRKKLDGLTIRPITLKKANAYVAEYHRHNIPQQQDTNGALLAMTENGFAVWQ